MVRTLLFFRVIYFIYKSVCTKIDPDWLLFFFMTEDQKSWDRKSPIFFFNQWPGYKQTSNLLTFTDSQRPVPLEFPYQSSPVYWRTTNLFRGTNLLFPIISHDIIMIYSSGITRKLRCSISLVILLQKMTCRSSIFKNIQKSYKMLLI